MIEPIINFSKLGIRLQNLMNSKNGNIWKNSKEHVQYYLTKLTWVANSINFNFLYLINFYKFFLS